MRKKVSHTFHCMLNAEDVIDMHVCEDDAAKDFSEKELVDRWATAIHTKKAIKNHVIKNFNFSNHSIISISMVYGVLRGISNIINHKGALGI